MSRLAAIAVLVSLWTGVATAGDVAPRQFIDLDQPGAFEALRQSTPTHFEMVRQIMSGVTQMAATDVPGWIVTNFHARDVRYAPTEKSYPKRRLSFVLDDTRYAVTP